MAKGGNQEVISILVQTRDQASKQLRQIYKLTKQNEKAFGASAKSTQVWNNEGKKLITNINKHSREIKELNSAMGKNQKQFAGWAMSLMFAGMALKRMFDTVWKSSTKTFNEISHSVEGTTTGFDMLQGSMKFLQYMVGDALQPVADALVPWIDKSFIQNKTAAIPYP